MLQKKALLGPPLSDCLGSKTCSLLAQHGVNESAYATFLSLIYIAMMFNQGIVLRIYLWFEFYEHKV